MIKFLLLIGSSVIFGLYRSKKEWDNGKNGRR